MSKYPARRVERALRKVEKDAVDVVAPAGSANPSVSFRYSYTYTEISATGSEPRVAQNRMRFLPTPRHTRRARMARVARAPREP